MTGGNNNNNNNAATRVGVVDAENAADGAVDDATSSSSTPSADSAPEVNDRGDHGDGRRRREKEAEDADANANASAKMDNGAVGAVTRHQSSPFKGQIRMAEDTLVGPCGKKRCADRYDSSESSDR